MYVPTQFESIIIANKRQPQVIKQFVSGKFAAVAAVSKSLIEIAQMTRTRGK